MQKVIIGADHNGFILKEKLVAYFKKNRISFEDLSSRLIKGDDYPDIAIKLARKVSKNKGKGILICGSGAGMAITANKIKGIRAAVTHDSTEAKLEREHNDINVLCLNGLKIKKIINPKKPLSEQFKSVSGRKSIKLVNIFLKTKSLSGRHKRRVNKINKL